jgi:8-oxo-dGTP diphosphatase
VQLTVAAEVFMNKPGQHIGPAIISKKPLPPSGPGRYTAPCSFGQIPRAASFTGVAMHPLIVTAAVIRKNGKILITRRPDGKPQGGLWEFPGGKLHDGESPQEALRRELVEELDLEIEVGGIFEVVYYRYDWGPVLILAYICRPLGGAIRNLEVAEHRWVTTGQIGAFDLLPADRPIVRKLIEAFPGRDHP